MIKSINELKTRPIEIDLTGPEGNAYCLLSYARSWSKDLDIDPDKVLDEMMSSDYENLITVLDNYFGAFVTLYR